MLKLMDETVNDEMGYTMVICYTEVTGDNVPPMAWVREVYDMLPRKCVYYFPKRWLTALRKRQPTMHS